MGDIIGGQIMPTCKKCNKNFEDWDKETTREWDSINDEYRYLTEYSCPHCGASGSGFQSTFHQILHCVVGIIVFIALVVYFVKTYWL